ncbi:MAG TPA: GNAT family N-acetyltransferase [Janthinobacterium sp.]|nr:GNAT family N-acetyltransferase [Janthinobacterium sp.]
MHPLDNPAWHALTQLQQHLGAGNELARHYHADISPIAAVADPARPECWAALAELMAPGQTVGIFHPGSQAPPTGWEAEWRYSFAQMSCTRTSFRAPVRGANAAPVRALTLADGAAMVALARLTRPGPMEERTVTMGAYLGVFDSDGTLLAMAGERMRLDGMVEVSGVCTHPEQRGRGYAQMLVALATERIVERGATAFLHVRDGNREAAGVYEKLGYSVRKIFDIASLSKPTAAIARADCLLL